MTWCKDLSSPQLISSPRPSCVDGGSSVGLMGFFMSSSKVLELLLRLKGVCALAICPGSCDLEGSSVDGWLGGLCNKPFSLMQVHEPPP